MPRSKPAARRVEDLMDVLLAEKNVYNRDARIDDAIDDALYAFASLHYMLESEQEQRYGTLSQYRPSRRNTAEPARA
jgi:hypothetical protein